MFETLFALWLVGFSIAYGIVVVMYDEDTNTNQLEKLAMAMCSWFFIGIVLGLYVKKNT